MNTKSKTKSIEKTINEHENDSDPKKSSNIEEKRIKEQRKQKHIEEWKKLMDIMRTNLCI